jgi:hypothetical protein
VAIAAQVLPQQAPAVAGTTVKNGGAAVVQTTVPVPQTVLTSINEGVPTPLAPYPSVETPVDNLKLQINNRMISGILTGKLTNFEMDEIQEMLDQVQREEADFKMGGCGLTGGAASNLMRKYHMVDQRLAELVNNTNFYDYMPNFELRRAFLQRHIQYDLAAGTLTPSAAEQLLAGVNTASDIYASAGATGGTLTGPELQASMRDLDHVYCKLVQRANGAIAVVAPAPQARLAILKTNIDAAIASKQFTDSERDHMLCEYKKLVDLQGNGGGRSADGQGLAKKIDNMNFILTRELHDRQIAAGRANPM